MREAAASSTFFTTAALRSADVNLGTVPSAIVSPFHSFILLFSSDVHTLRKPRSILSSARQIFRRRNLLRSSGGQILQKQNQQRSSARQILKSENPLRTTVASILKNELLLMK